MKKTAEKFPKSPRSHEVDNIAIKEFDYRCSSKWIPNPPKKDYGWDRMVTIKENDQVKGQNFLVQIKGTDLPKYINKNEYISYPLKVTTINFLLSYNMPSMLCVCDTSKDVNPIYWVWIQEAIKKIEEQNSEWKNQKTLSIPIPTSQTLSKRNYSIIEEYVKTFYENIYIQREIGNLIVKPYGITEQAYVPARNDLQKGLDQKVYSNLMELGVIDIISEEDKARIKSLSLEEQEIHKKIKESSTFLKSFHDKKAEEVLNQVSKDIQIFSDGIKAKYYNNCGVLALHNNEQPKAHEYFSKAYDLRHTEKKFAVNLLHIEYQLALNKGKLEEYLPDNWVKRLESLLKKNPDYSDALFLKAHWISKSKSILEAEKFLKQSSAWSDKGIKSRIFLADIYMDKLQFDKALVLFEEIENEEINKDEIFWSYYGHVLFFKSMRKKEVYPHMYLKGPGPPTINRSFLLRAEKYYDNALRKFNEKGMPKIAEQTIMNYAAVLSLLGKYKKSEYICKLYLDHHPESIPIIENLALSLSFQNNLESQDKAIQYAKKAFTIQPSSSRVFCNLILSLLLNEEYEEIIKLVPERKMQGFKNKNDEGLSIAIYAISLNELGYSSESKQQIKLMKKDHHLIVDTALAEAEIAKRNGVDTHKILNILKNALKKKPNNPDLLTKIAQFLKPVNKTNARKIINYLTIVAKIRQLTSGEFALLGKSFLEIDEPDKAHALFYKAINRYPEEIQFLYLVAISLYEVGREDDAFTCLKEYIKKSEKSYTLLKNLGILALNTGKIKQSVELFEKTLHKTKEPKDKAEIHCILYELKIRLKKSPKEILRHVVEYGINKEDDVGSEARFLIMVLMAPQIKKSDIDPEIESWIKDFNVRLKKFSEKHPDYNGLFSIKIPDNIQDEEKAQYLLSQLAYITLPARMAIAPFKISIEYQPWPLAFRAQFLPEVDSIFCLWSKCVISDKFSYAIHIWRDTNNLEDENKNAAEMESICIDINSLLSLAEFNLLDYLGKCFNKILISRGTKLVIDMELFSSSTTHPLAEKIEKWRINNLNKIRIRKLKSFEWKKENNQEIVKDKKIIIREEQSIDELIGNGVGESLLLAKKIECPLFSDDSLIREWATKNYCIKSFGTLSFLARLKNEGYISESKETLFYSQMIKKNFRIIPFQPYHLMSRLEGIVKERKQSSLPPPKNEDLKQDPILISFLKQFGNPSIRPEIRVNIAINWWISILQNNSSIRELIEECMEYISYCISQISKSGILKGIKKKENEHNAALLWSLFWWRCNLTDPKLNYRSWSAIKENCRRLFTESEQHQENVIFGLIPWYTLKIIKEDRSINEIKKIEYLVKLTECFESGEIDKNKLETAFRKLKPKFK